MRSRAGPVRGALHAAGARRRRGRALARARRSRRRDQRRHRQSADLRPDDILSGGNFHAEPLALLSDYSRSPSRKSPACRNVAPDLLDRRVNPALSMFLTTEPGLEFGFMIAHVAAAALTSENRTLAHPASVDNVTTSAARKITSAWRRGPGQAAADLLRTPRTCSRSKPRRRARDRQTAAAADHRTSQRVHALIRHNVAYRPYDHRLDRDIATLAPLIERRELTGFVT